MHLHTSQNSNDKGLGGGLSGEDGSPMDTSRNAGICPATNTVY